MTDGDKVAAALMACEATRAMSQRDPPDVSKDVAGEIWTYYSVFLGKFQAAAAKEAAEAAAKAFQ